MSNTTQLNFTVENKTTQVSNPLSGILFVEGEFQRGPLNSPSEIITSTNRFIKVFGDEDYSDKSALLCKRLLNKGAKLRINRVAGTGAAVAALNEIKIFGLEDPLAEHDTIVLTIGLVSFTQERDTNNLTTLQALATKVNDPSTGSTLMTAVVMAHNETFILYPKTRATIAVCTFQTTSEGTPVVVTDDVKTGPISIWGVELFTLTPKNSGEDGRYLRYTISPASNGKTLSYFNLTITHELDTTLVEKWENLKIIEGLTADKQNFLQKVILQSDWVDVTYQNLSSITDPISMAGTQTYYMTGGSDGASTGLSDYVGTSEDKTGFYAFDDYDDSYALAVLNKSDLDLSGLPTAGEAYAAARKDLRYYQHLDNSYLTAAALIDAREDLNIDSKYIVFTAGGLKLTDPTTNQIIEVSEVADVLANFVGLGNKVWESFAGPVKGKINNVLGVVNNFGSPAKFSDLNLLANRQINMVINQDGKVFLQDDYTGQSEDNNEKFISVNNCLLYLQKALRPTLTGFMKQPLDTTLFSQIFYTVKPFFKELVKLRALAEWTWKGDQDSTSLSSLQINTAEQVALGKYKIKLQLTITAPLTEMEVAIILTPAGVTFE